jgi:hypothetical protein
VGPPRNDTRFSMIAKTEARGNRIEQKTGNASSEKLARKAKPYWNNGIFDASCRETSDGFYCSVYTDKQTDMDAEILMAT